jgi:DnaK suppressor protein|tara:strand:+ start:84 stop:434 length:351 start_codon:yes stop_codon:yes gene_type:complete
MSGINLKIILKKIEGQLKRQRAELLKRTEITSNDRKAVELDQSQVGRLSRIDAIQIQEMALEQGRRRNAELLKIERALKRITDNEYGYCVKCEEAISPKRLEYDLATPLCINCVSS